MREARIVLAEERSVKHQRELDAGPIRRLGGSKVKASGHPRKNSDYGRHKNINPHESTFAILDSACSKLALEVANDSRT